MVSQVAAVIPNKKAILMTQYYIGITPSYLRSLRSVHYISSFTYCILKHFGYFK